MAFQTDKEYNTLTLSYWRITQINVNENGAGRVTLLGYRSKDDRDAGASNHFDRRSHSFGEDVYEEYFAPPVVSASDKNRVERAYEWLKTLDEWATATNV